MERLLAAGAAHNATDKWGRGLGAGRVDPDSYTSLLEFGLINVACGHKTSAGLSIIETHGKWGGMW